MRSSALEFTPSSPRADHSFVLRSSAEQVGAYFGPRVDVGKCVLRSVNLKSCYYRFGATQVANEMAE
jgi:hypothetical protein